MLDDALVHKDFDFFYNSRSVSILVMLDDALVRIHLFRRPESAYVSILVMLDDALVLEKQRLY